MVKMIDTNENKSMYEQKVIWFGTILDEMTVEDFEKEFLKSFGYHVKYEDEFTLSNEFFDNDLNCLIFSICEKDIEQFAIFKITRFSGEMRWWEDFLNDESQSENVPAEILKKYPKQW